MKKVVTLCFLFIGLVLSAQQEWEKHTAIADSLDLKLQFEKSLLYRQKAIKAATNQPDSIQRMLVGLEMFTRAEYDFGLSKQANPEAYTLMQNAVDTLIASNASHTRISKAYWDLNLAAFNYMHDREATEEFLNKSIEYHMKGTEIDTLFVLNTIHGASYMEILSGKYDQAIEKLEKGIDLFEKYKVKENSEYNIIGYLYSTLALAYSDYFLDIPRKNLYYNTKQLEAYSMIEEPDLEYYIDVITNLSVLERRLNNYDAAEGYIKKALSVLNQNKEKMHKTVMQDIGIKKELSIYHNLIIIYRETREKEKMLDAFDKIEKIVASTTLDQTEKNMYASLLLGIARYYTFVEYDFEKALYYNKKARSIDKKDTNIYITENDMFFRDYAYIYFFNKDYIKALDILKETNKTTPKKSSKIQNLELEIRCLLALNQKEEARKKIQEIIHLYSDENQSFIFPKSNINDFTPSNTLSDTRGILEIAEAWHTAHDNQYSIEEETLYWMALKQFEVNIGNTPLNSELELLFDKIISGLIDATLVRSFSTDENNRLLTFIETIKSQHLTENFLMKRKVSKNTQLYNLVEKEQYIRSYIALLKKEHQKYKDEETKQQLFEKELELKKINEQIVSQFRNSSQFTKPVINTNEISDKNVIRFEVSKGNLYKIRLYKGKLSYNKIEDYPKLKKEIEAYLTNINNLEIPVKVIKKQGESIYKRLFTDDFNTKAPTIIIPDDILYYLPFEVLVHNNQYLIENHTISYASNFYFLNTKSLHNKKTNNKKVAYFAPQYSGVIQESQLVVRGEAYSLAGAKEEVSQISKFVPGKVYLGDAASKTNFKALESDISILHLAMHSTLNDEDPELSNLMFSNSEEDYEMYISELYGLHFNAELAVLSACNTGIGGFKDGGDLVSMHHAFTTAGIPATVSSLWNAPDQSTKEIMIYFYKNLQRGENKSTALKQAKLEYLKNTRNENLQHPFYWAAFVLSGDDSPVLLPKPFWKKPSIIFGILALLGIIITMIFIKKRKM